jgi:vacuolar protein-sorting-associated protein 4
MSQQGRMEQAVELEKKARQSHADGNFQQAYNEYMSCLKTFEFVYRWEQNPRVKDMVRERIEDLVTTAEQLKAQLGGGSPQQSGGYGGGAASAQKPPPSQGGGGGGGGDAHDEEKEKLQKALGGQILTEKPNIKWGDVAGLDSAKDMLKETVIIPARFPHLFEGKRKPWKGILLYGPPGTGKSYLAKATATEVDGTFFSISSSDLVSKWQGESEKNVRTLFEMAREMKPSVIFVDEVDSLCGARGDGESEAARRIKTEFLTQMDGVGKDDGGQLLVLGATNTPWDLDAAIRRRFEKRIYIALPDGPARKTMLELNLGDTPNTIAKEELAAIAEQLDLFSGADISILTRDALMEPVRRASRAKTFKKVGAKYAPCSPADPAAIEMSLMDIKGDELAPLPITIEDFEASLEKCKSSINEEQLQEYVKWTEQFGMEG